MQRKTRRSPAVMAGLLAAQMMLTGSVAWAATVAPPDAGPQVEARAFLRAHDVDVTYDSLTRAMSDGHPDMVAALLIAGLQVGQDVAPRASMAVIDALATACAQPPVKSDALDQSLTLVMQHGLPIDTTDQSGNTMLMSAAQFCPAPVVATLLTLGAKPDPVNKQDFTPLQMAFVSGKWDVATVLIDHGARITRAQSKQIFFAPPQDPAQIDLLQRAIR